MIELTKKKKVIIGSISAVIIVAGIGIFAATRSSSGGSGDIEAYTTKVSTLIGPSVGLVDRFAGVVEPQETLKVQKASDKNVKEIFVQEGDTVTKGTPLFSYDVDEIQLTLSEAELELERITNEIANLYEQIELLQKEKESAPETDVFSYTTQILTAQNDVKRAEYNKKAKTVEIEQIRNSMENSTVVSEIDGIVKSINDGSSQMMYYDSNSDDAFITILSNSEYRIKGTINEQNMASITIGQPMMIHSRADEDLAWPGTVTEIDTQNPVNNENYYYAGDENTMSSSYNFYVELDEAALLMLGQHVFMEPDIGQSEIKTGLWLPDYYICFENDLTYVWVSDKKDRLEKREITLGSFDENLFEYEITSGLTTDDFIAFPDETLEEGMHCNKDSGMSEDVMK